MNRQDTSGPLCPILRACMDTLPLIHGENVAPPRLDGFANHWPLDVVGTALGAQSKGGPPSISGETV